MSEAAPVIFFVWLLSCFGMLILGDYNRYIDKLDKKEFKGTFQQYHMHMYGKPYKDQKYIYNRRDKVCFGIWTFFCAIGALVV